MCYLFKKLCEKHRNFSFVLDFAVPENASRGSRVHAGVNSLLLWTIHTNGLQVCKQEILSFWQDRPGEDCHPRTLGLGSMNKSKIIAKKSSERDDCPF